MKRLILLPLLTFTTSIIAQIASNAQFQIPYKKADVQLLFRTTDKGTPTPLEWGFDLAWLSEDNVRRGIAFCGQEVVDIMRLSFQPTYSVASGSFNAAQIKDLDSRISAVKKWCKKDITYNINCDHASLDEWYNDDVSTSAERAKNWAKLIDMTADYYKSKGLDNLVSISPLNEPDYEWHALPTFKHRQADFKEICKLLKTDPTYKEKYANVRLCGGNTLNDDQAYNWWNNLKAYLDEGNTHQLAGDFDHYADFYTKVRSAGHHATNDELHNSMEGMVGVEYGLQTAIWWGSAEYARAQFMKATYQGNPGTRLAYGEHRDNWSSATVYRQVNGGIQGFAGCSERQAKTTNFEYVSMDRDVYFNGQGPMRHFVLELPGGTGYGTEDQKSAETVFDIQTGEDVQPYINGIYHIVNKFCNKTGTKGKYLGFKSNPGTGWTQLQQNTKPTYATNAAFVQWYVTPVSTRIGGDFSYYDFRLVGNDKLRIDIKNWSLDSGAQVGTYPGDLGNLEQWYLQYAGDGWFYIRSKHSAMALTCNGVTAGSANVTQTTFKEGEEKQMWRFIGAEVDYDREAPEAPSLLTATSQPASIRLKWNGVHAEDIMGYDVLRAVLGTEDWDIVARNLQDTCFVDNSAEDDVTYQYIVRCSDKSLNCSEKSSIVEASVTKEKALICQLDFDNNLSDSSVNGNHALMADDANYNNKSTFVKHGTGLLDLTDGNSFVQLPSTIGHHNNLTVCCWVRRTNSAAKWERIFDFGNGEGESISLTPYNGSKMELQLKHDDVTEVLQVAALSIGVKHVAVTIDGDNHVASIYVNGELKGTKENIVVVPNEINGVCNYIGRSQYNADPIFQGYIDDFRVYNYALSAEEIANIIDAERDGIQEITKEEAENAERTYDLNGRPTTKEQGVKIKKGTKVLF